MKRIFVALFLLIFSAIFLPAYFYGLFTPFNITEKPTGPYKLIYDEHIGPYKDIVKVQDKIYYSLLSSGIKTYQGFGVYYDDPNTTPQEKLRSIGGCILEKADYGKIPELSKKFKIKDYPDTQSIYIEFPFKGTLSVIFGIIRVYPEIKKYQEKHNYKNAPVMEIYDVPNSKIIYIVPVQM